MVLSMVLFPDLDELSFGEYIDLDTYLGDWENIHDAMNVLYRPINSKKGDRYTIQEYDVKCKRQVIRYAFGCSNILGFFSII